ncbi:MAG: MFS transporter, partial [Sciscionella sp.]
MQPKVAVFAVFALNGAAYGSWAGRVPALADAVHVGPGGLGVGLLGVSIGMILAATPTGRCCERFGARAVVATGAGLDLLAIAGMSLAHSLPSLAVVFLLTGLGTGAMDVSMNIAGSVTAASADRPLMSIFHGGFSIGALLGALVAALAAALH